MIRKGAERSFVGEAATDYYRERMPRFAFQQQLSLRKEMVKYQTYKVTHRESGHIGTEDLDILSIFYYVICI